MNSLCFEYYNVLLLGGFCFFETFLHLFIYNWIVTTWTTFVVVKVSQDMSYVDKFARLYGQ